MKYRFTKLQIQMLMDGKLLRMNRLPVMIGQKTREELRALVAKHGVDRITVVWDPSERVLDVGIDN